MTRAFGALVFSLLLALPVLAGEAMPAPWNRVGRVGSAFETSNRLLRHEKLRGPYGDFSPLAHSLLDRAAGASRGEAPPLEDLALAAAPHDPTVRQRLAKAAFLDGRWGAGLADLATMIPLLVIDPWGRLQLLLQGALALCIAAWVVALAVSAWGLVARAGLAYHDYADVFPWKLRRFTPAAFAVFTAVVCSLGGVGPGLFLWAVGLLLAAYLPTRGRWALGAALLIGSMLPFSMGAAGRLSAAPGARAWALYRVAHGGGVETAKDLEKFFVDDDPRALYARARILRRGGDLIGAETLLRRGLENGGDGGLFCLELGNLRFLQGDYLGAMDWYDKATALRPKDPLPWFDRHVTQLANLDLVRADDALERAKALSGRDVARYQQALPEGSDELAPISDPLPSRWVFEAFTGGARLPPLGQGAPAGVLSPTRWVPAWLIGLVGLLVAGASGRVQKGRRSHRCPGCGGTVCPRCGYRIKESPLCAACWATREEAEADRSERDRQCQLSQVWRRKARRWGRWSRVLLPGWSDYLCDAPIRGAVVATIWSLGIGWAVAGWVRPVPFFDSLPVIGVGIAAAGLTHLWGAWRALRIES